MRDIDPQNEKKAKRIVDAELDGVSHRIGDKIGERWFTTLNNRVDLPQAMESPIKTQGDAENRWKPIGLFVGRDDLVKVQDEEFFATDSCPIRKKKRDSLCESFWAYSRWFRLSTKCTPKESPIPRSVLTPIVAEILQASAIPIELSPGELKQHVDERFDEVRNRKFRTGSMTSETFNQLKHHP